MISHFDWRDLPTAPFAFGLLALLWGGSFVAIEAGVAEWPPLLFAAVRYDLAGALVLGFAALRSRRLRPRTRDDVLAVTVVGVFVIFAHHALLYVGQQTVPGAVAATVIALSPAVTALLAPMLVGGERLRPVGYAGVAVGFLGVLAVTNPGAAGGVPTEGVALVFGATLAFALGSVLLRRVSPRLSLGALQGWGMLLGAGLLHAGSVALGEPLAVAPSTTGLAALAFLVVGPGVVAFLLYFRLLGSVGATRTNLVGYLEPVAAAALAGLLFGYVPTAGAVVGFALVFAGFALVKGDLLWPVVTSAVARFRATIG